MNLNNIEFTATITLNDEEVSKILKDHIEKAIECEVVEITFTTKAVSHDSYDRYTSYKFKDVNIKIKPRKLAR